MQRIKHIDQALQLWAEWRMAASGGYRSPSFEFRDNGYQFGAKVVEMNAEMERHGLLIDQAVAQLPRELSRTVVAHYTWEGGMEIVAAKLKVTRATVHRRLCHADIRIQGWLEYQQAKSRVASADEKNNFASYTN